MQLGGGAGRSSEESDEVGTLAQSGDGDSPNGNGMPGGQAKQAGNDSAAEDGEFQYGAMSGDATANGEGSYVEANASEGSEGTAKGSESTDTDGTYDRYAQAGESQATGSTAGSNSSQTGASGTVGQSASAGASASGGSSASSGRTESIADSRGNNWAVRGGRAKAQFRFVARFRLWYAKIVLRFCQVDIRCKGLGQLVSKSRLTSQRSRLPMSFLQLSKSVWKIGDSQEMVCTGVLCCNSMLVPRLKLLPHKSRVC